MRAATAVLAMIVITLPSSQAASFQVKFDNNKCMEATSTSGDVKVYTCDASKAKQMWYMSGSHLENEGASSAKADIWGNCNTCQIKMRTDHRDNFQILADGKLKASSWGQCVRNSGGTGNGNAMLSNTLAPSGSRPLSCCDASNSASSAS